MTNIVDERGYNQIFRPSLAQSIRLERRARAIAQAMAPPGDLEARQGVRLLEIGCGTGELAHHLARFTGARVTGVDLSAKFIEQARAVHHLQGLDFRVMDVITMPPAAPDQRYHFIVGNGILHHLYQGLDRVLPRLREWLLPGGRLVFWEPNLHNPYVFLIFSCPRLRRLARLEPDEMAFTRRFIAEKLSRAGYDGVNVTRRDFLLPNTPRSLIGPVTWIGDRVERQPFLSLLAQSLFIVAENPGAVRSGA